MEPVAPLFGSEIHGFHTTADLNIERIIEEDASKRWLRPNEIYAILSNPTLLKVQPQPFLNPESGKLLLFDRSVLRNFRKDGHNWRKKKDGKTVQEAHEKLKIGVEERIHVYYARSEDDPSFYRRCYWLLDRNLDRIVLVHYRRTFEDFANQQLPIATQGQDRLLTVDKLRVSTPLSSTSSSNHVETSAFVVFSDEICSKESHGISGGSGISHISKSAEAENHDLTLEMLETFDWDCLNETETIPSTRNMDTLRIPSYPGEANMKSSYQNVEDGQKSLGKNGNLTNSGDECPVSMNTSHAFDRAVEGYLQPVAVSKMPDTFMNGALQSELSFGQWDYVVDDIPGSFNDMQLNSVQKINAVAETDQLCNTGQIFNIIEFSPAWAYSNEKTKVLVVGHFHERYKHLESSNIGLICGDTCVPLEVVQHGVFRTNVLPHAPGVVNCYLTLNGQTPISQVVSFEFRLSEPSLNNVPSPELADECSQKDYKTLIRLFRLLFSASKSMSMLTNGVSPNSMKGVKRFMSVTSPSLEKGWMNLLKLTGNSETSSSSVNEKLFELVLKNKVQEWLLTRIAGGCKEKDLDTQGLGVIHLCAILDYTWAAHLFKASGLSLDFRDSGGWTALHWAAYCGRVKMVAALLSSGANPSLVTDPTRDFPGGCTAADLASQEGFEGLSAYLAESALTAHFQAMTLSGNITASAATLPTRRMNSVNLEIGSTEQEVLQKYSLAAYQNAADAADRITVALRARSLNLQIKAAQLASSELEAANIIAALKIQKAFRNHSRRKMMKAAARIQGTFRTWQARKNFINMKRQAIKIQAIFRGHLVRRQYRKIIWSVGVLEKAVLRWRLKKKGLRGRGLQVDSTGVSSISAHDGSCGEEDFYRISREQAEERINRSVVRVQAMFRSYRAQQDYRKMKLAVDQAKLEYDEFASSMD